MIRRVVWTGEARSDLLDIIGFIAKENPNAAVRVVPRIERGAAELGALATGRPGRVAGTHEKVLPGLPYILAYEILVIGAAEAVAVLHVVHAARHWPAGEWPAE